MALRPGMRFEMSSYFIPAPRSSTASSSSSWVHFVVFLAGISSAKGVRDARRLTESDCNGGETKPAGLWPQALGGFARAACSGRTTLAACRITSWGCKGGWIGGTAVETRGPRMIRSSLWRDCRKQTWSGIAMEDDDPTDAVFVLPGGEVGSRDSISMEISMTWAVLSHGQLINYCI